MNGLKAIFKKELLSFFITPLAYIYIAVFLLLAGVFTFYMGNFFERSQADLESFFVWHPWLYTFFIPAVAMKLWSEEMRSGTIEIMKTLPLSATQLVLGKFFATWVLVICSLLLTTPLWLTVNILGTPDNGVIAAGYLGSILLAGAYISICLAISSMTKNNIIAYIVSVFVCFIFTMSSFPLVINFFEPWAPPIFINILSSYSFLTIFADLYKGIISLSNITYFLLFISFWLYINKLNIL